MLKKNPRIRVRKRADGTHEARVSILGTRKSFYGSSEAEAYRNAEVGIAAVSPSWKGIPTFRAYTQTTYLPTIAQHSENWTLQVAWALDHHIYPAIGRRRIDTIKRADLHQLLMFKLGTGKKGLSRASVGHIRKVLHAVFSLAEADELILKNPVSHIKLPPARRVIVRPYTMEECARLLVAARGHVCYNALYCAITLGLRQGECLGLKKADIRTGRVHIARQHGEQPLKTEASDRTLPLPKGWADHLEKHPGPWISPERSDRNLVGSRSRQVKDKKTGKHVRVAGRGYARITEIAGLPYLPFHKLRKSAATALEEALCPQGLIGAILGHSSGSVTRLYIHNSEEVMRQSLQKVFDRLLENGVATPQQKENGAA